MTEIRVEGFDIEVRGDESQLREVLAEYGIRAREVLPGVANPLQFDVMVDGVDVGEAWELARRISADPRVVHAEPLLVTPGMRDGVTIEAAREAAVPLRNWQIEHCSIHEAWKLARGQGIVIGHPDTGYMKHAQIWSDDETRNRILHRDGFDFFKNDSNPLSDKSTHGTATASVIMSAGEDEEGVHGVAPEAKLIPIRVDDDVVHWRWGNVRKAIEWATAKNVDIISMSLGGPLDGDSLHRAVRTAVDRGIIVIAAAGNVWPFVVYPAKYKEVLGVAATNESRRKWADSARGPSVDVCAPGEDVHRATFEDGVAIIQESSGTSYATAILAGVAALWLSRHGAQAIRDRYGSLTGAAFRHVVMKHGVNPDPDWDTQHLGAGIVDAARVVNAELPTVEEVRDSFAAAREAASEEPRFEELAELFPDTDPETVRANLADLLQTREGALEAELERFGGELKLQLALNESLRARIAGVADLGAREAVAEESIPMSPSLRARVGA